MLTTLRRGTRGGVSVETPGAGRLYRVAVGVGLVAVVGFEVLAFTHRWVSDDGLIVVREVRQILAGNGPNYNPFQRDEVDTSPLWTWLLAAFAFVRRGDIAVDAVGLGLLCSVAGLLGAVEGSRACHRVRGATGVPMPVGVLVPLAVAAFWDFATSGMETGLSLAWLGAAWWLLAAVAERGGGRRSVVAAVVIGLGPLVRPEFALATVGFGVALLVIATPGWRRALVLCGVAVALPLAYQVFRMGYYGLTVPMPALAKEAGASLWPRGFDYLNDFVGTYQLWVPLAVICVVGTRVLGHTTLDRRAVALVAAPVVSGLLLGAYVVRVGGDYMHGRMWVPVVFALLLPVMVVPIARLRSVETVGVAALLLWALVAGLWARTPYQGVAFGPGGLTNERSYEAAAFSDPVPVTSASRLRGNSLGPTLAGFTARGRVLEVSSGVVANGSLWEVPLSVAVPDHGGFFYNNMGIAEVVMPLDGTGVDVNGLASPLAGHLELDQRGRPGHEKWLPVAWVLAEYADPVAVAALPEGPEVSQVQIRAARHALSCGALAELMRSVDQPMTFGRFWHNLLGSFGRTNLRVPADPLVAERQFCG